MNSEKTDNTETVESIIHEFNKQNADRIKDAAGQKIFQVNKKTGKVLSTFISLLSDSFFPNLQNSTFIPEAISSNIPDGCYIVSNSNFVHRVTHVSDTILVQDKNGRKIYLSIRCEISCSPGNEEKVAKALLSDGNKPEYNLNRFLKKCVYRFQDDIEVFISNFYASNLPGQIEKFIMDQKDPSDSSSHITGLTFHSVKCDQINIPKDVIFINIETKVGFRDSVKEHTVTLKCNLEISKTNNNPAHWENIDTEKFESIITENVKRIYYRSIFRSDSFNKSDSIENTLKKGLNDSLRTYSREIINLELIDLYVKSIDAKSRFEINPKRKNYLTADRENIGLEVPFSVKITDLMELDKSYIKDTHLLKEKLTECADSAITNFIANINAGEFYKKIKTEFAFKKSFVEEIRQKINNLIGAEVTVKNVDYGDTQGITKDWTSFEAVISKDMREFVITGSFSVVKDDISNIHEKVGRIFSVEDVKEKIIETLKASFIKRYLKSSEEFEKVAHDLLAETVSEAYGVLIKTQNIKAELTGLSFEDKAINEKIKDLKLRKIDLIANGGDYEKVEKLDERILRLEEYKEKITRNQEKVLMKSLLTK